MLQNWRQFWLSSGKVHNGLNLRGYRRGGEMQEKIYLGVKNHATGDYYVVACTVPVQIGKQHDVNNQILLDPRYRTISRVHGMIEKTSRGYIYSDSSANGSRVGGLVVRDSKVALSPSFQIDIENYSITKVEAHPFIILSTTPDLLQIQSVELLPGRGYGIADSRVLKNTNSSSDLAHWPPDEWRFRNDRSQSLDRLGKRYGGPH